MKLYLLGLCLLLSSAAQAQTIPFDPTKPVTGGRMGQTTVPPLNPALNQSTIQGPSEVQRAITNTDAQPSRLEVNRGFTPAATPELSPYSEPDVREKPLIQSDKTRQSSDIVPARSHRNSSSNIEQNKGARWGENNRRRPF